MVVVVRKYCSSVIIDENQLSPAHNILSTTKLKTQKQQKQPPHNNKPKRLLLQASSYISIGQYYKTKTYLFLTKKGMGSTDEGKPYEARFQDKYRNRGVHHVSRPQVISLYFKYSNVVGVHNQSRQIYH